MARTKLNLPDKFMFHTELSVRITDINYGQHAGNDALLGLLHEARLRFLAKHGFTEKDAGGCGLIMTDAILVFRSQAYHGDHLRVDMTVADFGSTGFDILYRVVRPSDDCEILRAKTCMAFFDYEAGRIQRVPQVVRKAMGELSMA